MVTAQRVWPPLLGLLIAAAVVLLLAGFTVDDALISTRYAFHIAQNLGHRFNAGGPNTDGVTPLPFPYLLAPFAGAGPIAALRAAKVLGATAWLGAATILAVHLGGLVVREAPDASKRRLGILAYLVAFATPSVGAWSVSGMETGLALAAVTVAAVLGSSTKWRLAASLLLGLAGTLRPELMPFALTLSVGCAFLDVPPSSDRSAARIRSILGHTSAAAIPFAVVTAVRWFAFGSAAPLSVRAKPSDLQHGLVYAAASCLIAGPPLAVLAPWVWRKLVGWPRWLLVAFAVHSATCVAVGGDWMPMSRLFVPVLPALAIVFAHLAREASAWSTLVRGALCVAGQVFVFATIGPAAARVGEDRLRLIQHLHSRAHADDIIASVDIGWVGAAHEGRVVDLAGVVDPHVAALPGGHTSKRIPEGVFDARGVTHILLLLPPAPPIPRAHDAWDQCDCARIVEQRICRMPTVRESFALDTEIRSTDRLRYLLLKRRDGR